MITNNWKTHAERVEKQGRLNPMWTTLIIETIDELKEERESLLQRINLLTIAGNEALKQRNDALDEAAGHKKSLMSALERNLKLTEYCGDAEKENERLRKVLQNIVNTGQSPLGSRRKAKEMTAIALEALEGTGNNG